jgi:phytoene dehydrogenase-like protein
MLVTIATYTTDLEHLSADAMVGQLQRAITTGVDYLDGGWGRLVDALADRARGAGATVETTAARGIVEHASGWEVETADGPRLARAVVVATGGPAAARALLPDDPGWGELAPDVTVACEDLGLRRVIDPPIAFDLRAPRYLSSHCPPAELAPPGASVVHLMRYGARTSTEDRADLRALAEAAGIREADVVTSRFLHRMVVQHAPPRPGRGLAGRPGVAVDGCPGVFVAGDWVGPRGLLADASLASARDAATEAARHLRRLGTRATR